MDVAGFFIGFSLGAVSSCVFFAGLYITIQATVRVRRPVTLLAISAVMRLGLILAAGYFVTQLGLAYGLGFFVAFPLVRYAAISWSGSRLDGLKGA